MDRVGVERRWRVGLLAVGLVGCSGKGAEEPACPEGIIAVVGAAQWSTLEGAMGSVGPGSEIEVDLCPGRFSSRTFVSEPGGGWDRIIIRGHPDGTILDGTGDGTVIDLEGDGTVELHDLTIMDGYADNGGGGYRGRGNQLLILDNVVFQGNQAPKDGGAVRMLAEDDGSVLIEDGASANVQFIDNHAGGNGGAVSLSGAGFASFSPGTWVFEGNSAGVHGGAASVESGDVLGLFGDLVATDNAAGSDGGVLYVDGPSAAGLALGRVDAANNRAGGNGGVIRLARQGAGDFNLASGELIGNQAAVGGALSVAVDWSVQVSATTMRDNIPDDVGYGGETYLATDLGTVFTCQPDAGCVGGR